MPLVTDAEVREIVTLPASLSDLTAFIAAADLLVTEELAASGLSAARQKEICRWLAAHFAVMNDETNRLTADRTGEAESSFGGQLGKYLEFTRYGQQALLLDTSGTLKEVGEIAVVKPALFRTL